MTKIKHGLIALLCAIASLTVTKGSANECCPTPCPTYNDCCFSLSDLDLGVGIFYDEKTDHMIPYLTLLYKCFTLGFGVAGERIDRDFLGGSGATLIYYEGHLGLRYCLCPCLYLTGGVSGMWAHSNHRESTSIIRNPFVVGPYIGFDYHLSSCLLLTAQILPYARHRHFSGDFRDQYFQQGMIGVSYLF